jgi:predicted DNA-binding protein with PD1-like motif
VLRLDPGDEIVESLAAFAERNAIGAGLISGIGAVGEAELGFFDRHLKEYVRKLYRGEFADMVAVGGHLFRAVVTVTCEVHLVTDAASVRRVRDAERGFSPLDLREHPGA